MTKNTNARNYRERDYRSRQVAYINALMFRTSRDALCEDNRHTRVDKKNDNAIAHSVTIYLFEKYTSYRV